MYRIQNNIIKYESLYFVGTKRKTGILNGNDFTLRFHRYFISWNSCDSITQYNMSFAKMRQYYL